MLFSGSYIASGLVSNLFTESTRIGFIESSKAKQTLETICTVLETVESGGSTDLCVLESFSRSSSTVGSAILNVADSRELLARRLLSDTFSDHFRALY